MSVSKEVSRQLKAIKFGFSRCFTLLALRAVCHNGARTQFHKLKVFNLFSMFFHKKCGFYYIFFGMKPEHPHREVNTLIEVRTLIHKCLHSVFHLDGSI